MTNRTQYRANCSHCGRDHAVHGVVMVKHGYKVPTGWHQFVGQCPGTNLPHFGTAAGLEYRQAIANATRDLHERQMAQVDNIRAGGTVCKYMRSPTGERTRHGMIKSDYYPVATPSEWERRDWASHVEHTAHMTRRIADEIQATCDAWVACEPRAVVIEERVAPLHFAAKLYGNRATGACVASAMGAQRFAGMTTEDAHVVTCVRCLARIEARAARAAAKGVTS